MAASDTLDVSFSDIEAEPVGAAGQLYRPARFRPRRRRGGRLLVRRGPGGRRDAAGRPRPTATSARMRWPTSARSTSPCTRPGPRSSWPPPRSTPTPKTATLGGRRGAAGSGAGRGGRHRGHGAGGPGAGGRPAVPRQAHSRRVADLTVYLRQHHAEARPGPARQPRGRARGRMVSGLAPTPSTRPAPRERAWDSWRDLRQLPAAELLVLAERRGRRRASRRRGARGRRDDGDAGRGRGAGCD